MSPVTKATAPRRLVVGITGATGIIYGIRALEVLRKLGIESHLVVSKAGEMTRDYEAGLSREQLQTLADVVHPIGDVGASIASGSFQTMGMLIAPCSVRTLAEVASGVTTTLLTRAADVVLKERRRLVLMVREAPLHAGHIRNMLSVTEMGGIIHPRFRPSTLIPSASRISSTIRSAAPSIALASKCRTCRDGTVNNAVRAFRLHRKSPR